MSSGFVQCNTLMYVRMYLEPMVYLRMFVVRKELQQQGSYGGTNTTVDMQCVQARMHTESAVLKRKSGAYCECGLNALRYFCEWSAFWSVFLMIALRNLQKRNIKSNVSLRTMCKSHWPLGTMEHLKGWPARGASPTWESSLEALRSTP